MIGFSTYAMRPRNVGDFTPKIPVEQIARLAELYDLFNNALDPSSERCRAAKTEFEELAIRLHASRASELPFLEFRYELGSQLSRISA